MWWYDVIHHFNLISVSKWGDVVIIFTFHIIIVLRVPVMCYVESTMKGFHSASKITAKSWLTEHIQNSFSSPTTTNCIIPLIFLPRPGGGGVTKWRKRGSLFLPCLGGGVTWSDEGGGVPIDASDFHFQYHQAPWSPLILADELLMPWITADNSHRTHVIYHA